MLSHGSSASSPVTNLVDSFVQFADWSGVDDPLQLDVATALRYLVCTLLLTLAPSCLAQGAKIRVINGASGRPLPKLAVSVTFFYDKKYDKEIPTNYQASLNLETDENGEARFKFPQPPPVHFAAQVGVDWAHWNCCGACGILGSTDDLVREGINGCAPVADEKKFPARYKAAPGEILFVFHPLSFFERLFYQLLKE